MFILHIKEEPWKEVIQSLSIQPGKDPVLEVTKTSYFLFFYGISPISWK